VVQWEVPPTRRIAFVIVLVVAASAVVATLTGRYRTGGYVLAGALLLAAATRATMPEKYCLGLLVRSRRVDVIMDAVLGVAVLVTARIVP
jgi:hypothetical protein